MSNEPIHSELQDHDKPVQTTKAQLLPTEQEEKSEPENPGITFLPAVSDLEEADESKAFAFDINQKIDTLQENIDELAGGFNRSKGDLASALGDLQSRTASITNEIDEIAVLIEHSDSNKQQLIQSLEHRLADAVASLTDELGGVESQINHQHASLTRLQIDLAQSYKVLNDKLSSFDRETQQQLDGINEAISHLQIDTQDSVEGLKRENAEQNKTQQVFSDYLDQLNAKTDTTADELYQLNTDVTEHKRLTGKYFQYVSGSIAAVALITTGLFTYFHYNDGTDSALLDQKLAQHNADMNELYAEKAATSAEIFELNKQVSDMNSQVLGLQGEMSDSRSKLADLSKQNDGELDELLSKVSAIELSIYGPADTGELPPPTLSIEDADWIALQPESNYVIQLVGVYRERSIISFVNRHTPELSQEPLSTNVSQYRGQNWHNLYFGNFTSFNEAQSALESLPEAIQRNAPWIRTIGSVKRTASS